jgi:uncharacterized protein YjiS (DUF1127 family)
MLRKIYRAMALAQAASAANQMLLHVSDRQLDDIGISRETFAAEMKAKVQAEFDAQDAAKANKSVRKMVNHMINPNLAGAV